MFLLLLVQELSIFEPPGGVQLDGENLVSKDEEPEQVGATIGLQPLVGSLASTGS
jgi:hypothetical protein